MGKHRGTKERHEAYKTYKAEGHSNREVAERFGISIGTASQVCKGIAPQQSRPGIDYQAKNQYTSESFDREANARRWVEEKLTGFEYAGNFTGIDGFADIRCTKCGAVSTKSFVAIRHGHARCSNCIAIANEAKADAKRKAAEERKRITQENKANREAEAFLATRLIQCEECGTIFATRNENRVCCSTRCSRKRLDRLKEVKRRIKLSDALVDKGITLQELYQRENGVCYLCGGKCEWNDKEEIPTGIVCGNSYPSIDHVLPLALGGKHEWSNIRLAHRSCNAKKADKVLPLVIK